MKWTTALDSFHVFSNLELSRLGRKAFLSWTMSSREESRSLQLPHALCPGSHFKGTCLWGKARAHWPIFIYSLIPCKLVFFLKIKSKKYFGSCLFGPPPGGHICFLYFWAGCSTSLVLMELVSFLDPPLLLMFLLLVSSSMFVVSLTIFFLLAVLYNSAVRWISLTEYLSNKLSNIFFCSLLLGFITTVFFFPLSDSHPSVRK